ncbi:MAG: F0F1 ATP synthase subunit A [Actinomycetota bacterium]
MTPILAFQPPTAPHLFEFQPIFGLFCKAGKTNCALVITFPTLIMFALSALLVLFFWRAMRKRALVPVGAQNVAEGWFDFVEQSIVLPVIGPEGSGWSPFLVAMFFWVFFMNIMEITPGVQFPITSRMAFPTMLALLAWVLFNGVGIKEQGFFKYFKGIMFPPGVPKVMYILLTPLEFFSTIIVRPLTLALRLAANMIAGHMLLAVLFIGTGIFIQSGIGRGAFILPLGFGTIMTAFEIFVSGMQAFIITILTAVYIAGAAHPEH